MTFIGNELDWDSREYESYGIPGQHLSPQSRQIVEGLRKTESLCAELCQYYNRFSPILPTDRLFTHDHRALSGLRLADLKYHGLQKLVSRAEENLKALQHCETDTPCNLIGCPSCSSSRRAKAMYAAAKFICGVIAYNHQENNTETVVFSVTVANRRLWCVPLKNAEKVLTGRRNKLRQVIQLLAGKEIAQLGRITDVLASVDIKYQSPIDPTLNNSRDKVIERLEADCDIHLHALICFTPYVKGRFLKDLPKVILKELCASLPPPFDVHVQPLDHDLTREKLIQCGIQCRDLNSLVLSTVYQLAYQTKTTTLDSVSSRERPLIQAAIAGPLKHLKGIMRGAPIVLRSECYERIAAAIGNAEREAARDILEIESMPR